MIDLQFRWAIEHQDALRAERRAAHEAQAGQERQHHGASVRRPGGMSVVTDAMARFWSSIHGPRMHGPTAHLRAH